MPQPFSQFHRGEFPKFQLGPTAIAEQPLLAMAMAQAVAIWAFVEQELGSLLVKMLGGDAGPSLAMYTALSSTAAQNAALNAAAEATMSPAVFKRFSAVKRVVASSVKVRHKLVHHIWGHSEQAPDALLLADPRYLIDMHFQVARLREMSHDELQKQLADSLDAKGMPQMIKMDTSKIFVYTKDDFSNIIKSFAETAVVVSAFSEFLTTPKMRAGVMGLADPSTQRRVYRKLFRLPRYREALRRIRDQSAGKALPE